MKKFILVTLLLLLTFNVNAKATTNDENFYESKTFYITSVEVKQDKSKIYNFNNGSCVYINDSKGIYEFFPYELGDWSYYLQDKNDLKNIVATYGSIKTCGYY